MVGALLSSKVSAVKRMSREDLPTPESPTSSTCKRRAPSYAGAGERSNIIGGE